MLVASGWQDLCTRFHRANETTAAGCLESDRRINERVLAGMEAPEHIAYQCVNGLWDVAFPLIVDGHHLANVFTGQFFYDDDDIDVETFRTRARELGFDEDAYMDALDARAGAHPRAGRPDHGVPHRPGRHAQRVGSATPLRDRETRPPCSSEQRFLQRWRRTRSARACSRPTRTAAYLSANAAAPRCRYDRPR